MFHTCAENTRIAKFSSSIPSGTLMMQGSRGLIAEIKRESREALLFLSFNCAKNKGQLKRWQLRQLRKIQLYFVFQTWIISRIKYKKKLVFEQVLHCHVTNSVYCNQDLGFLAIRIQIYINLQFFIHLWLKKK